MKKLFFLLPFIFCLSACWDYTEPGMQNYVLGVGIDYKNGNFNLSVETVKITGEATSLSAAEGVIINSQGVTLYDAIDDAIAKAGKKLYWGHTELIIMSDSVASNHLSEVCDLIARSEEIYSNVNLLISPKVSAAEILSAKTPRGGMVSVHIASILENEAASHRFRSCELWQLQRNFPYTLIPVTTLEEYPVVKGSAIICQNTLRGYLSDEETQITSLAEGAASGVKLPDIVMDNAIFSTQILKSKKENEVLSIDITLLGSSSLFDAENPKMRKRLEEKISSIIEDKITALKIKFGEKTAFSDDLKISVTLKSSGLIKR